MSLSIVFSRGTNGIHAPIITVETHISNGLPRFAIVGLPEITVKESKDRVRSALINAHFNFPYKRITVNLAPADLPKEGGRFDLPIAIGILIASGQLDQATIDNYEFVGELALSGELRAITASLPTAIATRQMGRKLIIPWQNMEEVGLLKDIQAFPARHLLQVFAHLQNQTVIARHNCDAANRVFDLTYPDISEVKGQAHAKRALEIAAAGGHSLLMQGPPGTGKSMLASRLPGILPPMTDQEMIEVASIYSISKSIQNSRPLQQRPYRAPHHSASHVALVGGGSPPKPGEISLAHHGVLFLDELPEFDRKVLESLREPLENGSINISRAARQVEFPAQFQLIVAMNPCPCGYKGDQTQLCRCTPEQINRYRAKISGPLLDRIDMQIEMPRFQTSLLMQPDTQSTETSAMIRTRVNLARNRQNNRSAINNAKLNQQQIQAVCQLDTPCRQIIDKALQQWQLSARGYYRVLRVARTIADLAGSENIEVTHLLEALSYRRSMEVK